MNLDGYPVIYRRLFKFARTLVRGEVAAMDLASDTYANIFPKLTGDAGADFAYGSAALRNRWRAERRNARRRGYDDQIDINDPVSMRVYPVVTQANQEICVELSRALAEIERLGDVARAVMSLAVFEYSPDEIAATLKMEKKEVYWRLQHARKILRAQTGRAIARKDSQHIGIRRECHRWQASIRRNGKYINLGRYDSASEAADAYARAAAA